MATGWAVASWASEDMGSFLSYAELSVEVLLQQIVHLAAMHARGAAGSGGGIPP